MVIESLMYLHSIMYLLILKLALKKEIRQSEFTFHNVSINSRSSQLFPRENFNLHSIMYLLIPSSNYHYIIYRLSSFSVDLFLFSSSYIHIFIIISLSAYIYPIVDLPIFSHHYWSTIFITST